MYNRITELIKNICIIKWISNYQGIPCICEYFFFVSSFTFAVVENKNFTHVLLGKFSTNLIQQYKFKTHIHKQLQQKKFKTFFLFQFMLCRRV